MAQKQFFVDLNLNKNQAINFRIENTSTAPTSPATGQLYYDTDDNKFYGWNGSAWIDLSQVVTGSMILRGEISNANTAPSYPASPTAGDMYMIVTNAGTVGGTSVEVGDALIYSSSGWFVLEKNNVVGSETVAGNLELATQSEVNAGTDDQRAVTTLKFITYLINQDYVRGVATAITTLTANTPTTVTHGLSLANSNDIIVQCYQGGEQIELRVTPTTVNAIQVESNTTLGSVRVVCMGMS